MSRNEINKQSIWHHSISKVNSKLNFCRFINFVTYMMFLMISWNITTCCVNCNLVKEGVTELLDTNKIPYLLHHLDYWLSFCIPTWESKSVWINRSHIRGQHTWAILFCSCKFWALILFRMRKLCITVYVTKKKDVIQTYFKRNGTMFSFSSLVYHFLLHVCCDEYLAPLICFTTSISSGVCRQVCEAIVRWVSSTMCGTSQNCKDSEVCYAYLMRLQIG